MFWISLVKDCKGSQRQIQRELIVDRTWTCSIWGSWIAAFWGHILRTNTNKKDRHISEALKLFRKPLIIYRIMEPITHSSSQTFQKYGHSTPWQLLLSNRKDLKPGTCRFYTPYGYIFKVSWRSFFVTIRQSVTNMQYQSKTWNCNSFAVRGSIIVSYKWNILGSTWHGS